MESERDEALNFDELPRCHYCQRYAFEIHFQGMAICERCLDNMTTDRVWRCVRDVDGAVWVTTSEAPNMEEIGRGTFTEMWTLCHKDDPNYG